MIKTIKKIHKSILAFALLVCFSAAPAGASQVADYAISGSPLTMTQLATELLDIFYALGSSNRGGSAPSNPYAGMAWIDTSVIGQESLNYYTAAGWTALATINTATGAVTYALGNGTVVEAKIADGAITTGKLATGGVTTSKLSSNSVTTDKLAGLNVTTDKLADNSVTDAKLATKVDKTILSNISGVTAVPTGNSLSAIFDSALGSAQGSVIFRGSSGWAALSPGTSSQYLKGGTTPSWGTPTSGGVASHNVFATSGTWTKPSNLTSNSVTLVEMWGGGGAGGVSCGGGGGGYSSGWFKTSDLSATETITVGTGGANQADGSHSSFGTRLYAYGGAHGGSNSGGGGGSTISAGTIDSNKGYGGLPDGGGGGDSTSGAVGKGSRFGGGGGGAGDRAGGSSVYGGGGGGGAGGGYGTDYGAGGTSVFGGAGGAGNNNGTAPGGGGGANYKSGGRGEVRVTTWY